MPVNRTEFFKWLGRAVLSGDVVGQVGDALVGATDKAAESAYGKIYEQLCQAGDWMKRRREGGDVK